MSRKIDYIIPEEYDGKKVIHYLRGEKKYSVRLVSQLKQKDGGLTLNGGHIRTIDRIHSGDVLSVCMPDDSNGIEPIEYPLDIVYEDEDIMVIKKPSGLAMHPTHNHQGDTLANAVTAYLMNNGKNASFRAVGRLDKQTSGLVLLAMNKYSASFLPDRYEKEYCAIVGGTFKGSGTIDKCIYRPDPMKTLRAAGDSGDRAVTHWIAEATDGKRTLVNITLETGRTHQIRVHFASLGAPLAGDDMYGSTDNSIDRTALHCKKLTLTHPVTNEVMTFEVDIPEDMMSVLNSGFVKLK